jgi:type IV pilus assembly protein PilM
MAKNERILVLDIGASSIKAGEIEYSAEGVPTLVDFAYREYDEEPTDETRSMAVATLLKGMLLEHPFTTRTALISISGQLAFTRFVKLPPISEERGRIQQIVEFEAKQNVPFPMEEVIWDYQLIHNEGTDEGELEVMFVVVQNSTIEQITAAVESAGLNPILVDVASAACYNAARANHIGDEKCAVILNIGGRSTNLLFAEGKRFFARTIPIAGHSITQQIAKQFNISFQEAEELKRRHGFVSLGGAYEEPESEVAAAVSKIVRNVMARLHGEINRSINVYRAQQKGSKPEELYLTGGSSTMGYTDHFFAEKLHMETAYLNPFEVVTIGPDVNRQELELVAHMFSEVVGLALRYQVRCPVEISLIPERIQRRQAFRSKKPYLHACMGAVIVTMLVVFLGFQRKASMFQAASLEKKDQVATLENVSKQIQGAEGTARNLVTEYEDLVGLFEQRGTWPALVNQIARLKPESIWLTAIEPIGGEDVPTLMMDEDMGMGGGMGMPMMGGGGAGMPTMGGGGMSMPTMGGGGSGTSSSSGGGGGGTSMPGGMMMGGMMGMGGGDYMRGGPMTVSGLLLTGYAVASEKATSRLAEGEADIQEEEEDLESQEAEEDSPDEGEDEELEPDLQVDSSTPEALFVARRAELIDEDEEYTGLKSYNLMRDTAKNLTHFTIQLRLVEPITVYED